MAGVAMGVPITATHRKRIMSKEEIMVVSEDSPGPEEDRSALTAEFTSWGPFYGLEMWWRL
jgi:hypothetical protein